jgi:hypothetical protein
LGRRREQISRAYGLSNPGVQQLVPGRHAANSSGILGTCKLNELAVFPRIFHGSERCMKTYYAND